MRVEWKGVIVSWGVEVEGGGRMERGTDLSNICHIMFVIFHLSFLI